MNKGMLWTGVVITAIGAAILAIFVVPHVAGFEPMPLDGRNPGPPALLGVVTAAIGLAAGFALIGIGVGRWKHPRPSATDGSPEV